MDFIKDYKEKTKIGEEEIISIFSHLISMGDFKEGYKTIHTIDSKEGINKYFLDFLENLLSNDLIPNKNTRLGIIKLIETFNLRNELFEFQKKDIKQQKTTALISQRLQKKAQSSFSKSK